MWPEPWDTWLLICVFSTLRGFFLFTLKLFIADKICHLPSPVRERERQRPFHYSDAICLSSSFDWNNLCPSYNWSAYWEVWLHNVLHYLYRAESEQSTKPTAQLASQTPPCNSCSLYFMMAFPSSNWSNTTCDVNYRRLTWVNTNSLCEACCMLCYMFSWIIKAIKWLHPGQHYAMQQAKLSSATVGSDK